MISAFVLSQIFALISFVFDLASFQCRDRTHTLLLLSIAQAFAGAHFFLLDATTAGTILLLSSTRFFIGIFTTKKLVMYIFIALILVVGFITVGQAYDLLPVVGGILGTLGAFSSNKKRMRQFFMGGTSTAIIFNILIFSPVAIVSELFFLSSNLLSYWRFYIRKNIN
jgi:hypothetical protein